MFTLQGAGHDLQFWHGTLSCGGMSAQLCLTAQLADQNGAKEPGLPSPARFDDAILSQRLDSFSFLSRLLEPDGLVGIYDCTCLATAVKRLLLQVVQAEQNTSGTIMRCVTMLARLEQYVRVATAELASACLPTALQGNFVAIEWFGASTLHCTVIVASARHSAAQTFM